ncbi:MAG: ABC transporter permease subunit [Pseudomonadota bacterium]
MAGYLFKRTFFAFATFLVVVSAVFFLLRAAPGGPFDGERRLPPDIEANLQAAYHLDEPLAQQYARYLGNLAQGDLGPSFRQKDFSVSELIALGLPTSVLLGLSALAIAVLVGTGVGIAASLSPGSGMDRSLMALNNVSIAVPTIVTAPALVLLFAVILTWLPAGGSGSLQHFVLPAIALALPYAAAVARLIRGAMIEAAAETHVLTARAKGLSQARIIRRHMLPIAAVPLISFLGPTAAGLLTGSVVVEQIFDLPGIGRYFVQGALARDYTLVMGVVVVYSSAILSFNLLVDLAYGWLDPRIRAA